jgi:hypothetical protein
MGRTDRLGYLVIFHSLDAEQKELILKEIARVNPVFVHYNQIFWVQMNHGSLSP